MKSTIEINEAVFNPYDSVATGKKGDHAAKVNESRYEEMIKFSKRWRSLQTKKEPSQVIEDSGYQDNFENFDRVTVKKVNGKRIANTTPNFFNFLKNTLNKKINNQTIEVNPPIMESDPKIENNVVESDLVQQNIYPVEEKTVIAPVQEIPSEVLPIDESFNEKPRVEDIIPVQTEEVTVQPPIPEFEPINNVDATISGINTDVPTELINQEVDVSDKSIEPPFSSVSIDNVQEDNVVLSADELIPRVANMAQELDASKAQVQALMLKVKELNEKIAEKDGKINAMGFDLRRETMKNQQLTTENKRLKLSEAASDEKIRKAKENTQREIETVRQEADERVKLAQDNADKKIQEAQRQIEAAKQEADKRVKAAEQKANDYINSLVGKIAGVISPKPATVTEKQESSIKIAA